MIDDKVAPPSRSIRCLSVKHVLIVFILLLIIGTPLLAQIKKYSAARKLDQVEEDWKEIQKALIAYGIDRCGIYYPPDTIERCKINPSQSLTFELDSEFITHQPTGKDQESVKFWTPLTTPVAYLKEIPKDPFRPGETYGYTCWNLHDGVPVFALLHSPGPDRVDDLPLKQLREQIDAYFQSRCFNSIGLMPEDLGVIWEIVQPYFCSASEEEGAKGDLIWILGTAVEAYGWRIPVNDKQIAKLKPEYPLISSSHTGSVDESWNPGDPFPSAQTQSESINRNREVVVPSHLFSVLIEVGIIDFRYNGNKIHLDVPKELQNHLGKDFVEFFQSPGTLSDQEIVQLERWQKLAPRWWNILGKNQPFVTRSQPSGLPAEDLYIILPILGKSQLLLAAQDGRNGQTDQALNRIENLRTLIQFLKENAYFEKDPYEKRVQEELTRLCNQVESSLKST